MNRATRAALILTTGLLACALPVASSVSGATPAMRAGKKCTKRHRHARKRCRRHAPAALSISPQGKDFGTIGTADGSPADFVVTNRGDLRSGIPAPSLSGSGISHFTISGTTCVSPLARHGTCTVTVQSIHNDGATAMAQLNVGATPGGNTSALLIVNIY